MTGDPITTARLLLRRWRPADRTPLAAILGDARFARYVGNGQPLDREAVDAWIVRARAEWLQEGFGRWAVVERRGEQLAGYCGLIRPDPGDRTTLEIVYGLATSFWGRGYATEAALAVRDHAFGALGCETVIGFAHPDNLASQRVLRKLGLRLGGRRELESGRVLLRFRAPRLGAQMTIPDLPA